MSAELLIDIPKTVYRPGGTVTGEVLWSVDEAPGAVELTLGWWTEGRGTKDATIEAETRWETAAPAGKERFSLQLPASPYSFSGQLITLKWALELRTREGGHSVTQEIVVSTGPGAVDLPKIDESRRKSFSFFGRR